MPTPVTLADLLSQHAIPFPDTPPHLGAALPTPFAQLPGEVLVELISHLEELFTANPSIRIPVISTLQTLTASNRAVISPALVTSPFFPSLLNSLLLDTSPTLFSGSISLFSTIFPYSPAQITPHVPVLVTVLARAACWRPRHMASVSRFGKKNTLGGIGNTVPSGQLSYLLSRSEEHSGEDAFDLSSMASPSVMSLLGEALREQTLPPRPELGWKVYAGQGGKEEWRTASSTLHTHSSSIQAPRHNADLHRGDEDSEILTPAQEVAQRLLMDLHGIWPSNVVAFIRNPLGYLATNKVDCPYVGGWEGVWEPEEVPIRMSPLLKAFAFNPNALFADAPTELASTAKFAKLDPATVAVTAHSLYRGYVAHGGIASLTSGPSATSATTGAIPITSKRSMLGLDTAGSDPESPSSMSMSSSPPNYKKARPEGMTIGAAYTTKPIAIGAGGGGGGMGGGYSAELENLRLQVAEMKRELTHKTHLNELYLSHVHRLHKESMAFASDEAERQLLFISFKDQKNLVTSLRTQLAEIKAERDRSAESTKNNSASLRDRISKLRDENRKSVGETSKARAELEDSKRVVNTLRAELATVKDTNFKLNNKLTEADPHMRHIEDYREEIRIFKENQLKWDGDIRKLHAQDETISLMKGRWTQMEQMVVTSNKIMQKATEEAKDAREKLADSEEKIRVLKLSSTRQEPQKFVVEPAEREMDKIKGLLLQARERIDQLRREKLEIQADLEAATYSSSSQAAPQTSMLS